jgi:hypothetical protein
MSFKSAPSSSENVTWPSTATVAIEPRSASFKAMIALAARFGDVAPHEATSW